MKSGTGRAAKSFFAAFMPGALIGIQVAGLLFFLNPHLPFDTVPMLRGAGFYGLPLGLVSWVGLYLLSRRRPGGARRLWPISLTVVLAAAAVGAWFHASYFAFYLPDGINRRLLKAAIWLSLAALICFYTVLLHSFRQRRYGRRSHALFVLMALVAIYVLVERRDAFRPRPEPAPRATTFVGSQRPQLLVVGLEAATLDAILPLAQQGRLPFLATMLREGSYSRLRSLRPARRSVLWTTLATGKLPFRHGVVGERIYEARFLDRRPLRLLPVGIGFRAWGVWDEGRKVDSRDVTVLRLWQILERMGIATDVVGWPLTSPFTPGQHAMLAERFFATGDAEHLDPAELAERARLFRPRVGEIDPVLASRFGNPPDPADLEALAGDLWREQLSFFLLDREPAPDALFTLLPGLAAMSTRYFGGFSAVQFDGSQQQESQRAARLLSAYYAHLDDFLARLWARTPEPRLLAVVSAHGVEDPYGWRDVWRQLSLQPAVEGFVRRGPDGVILLLGEGIVAGALPRTAEITDPMPTLLYGLGLPIARDFDGSVITSAFDTAFLARRPLSLVPSYETFARPVE